MTNTKSTPSKLTIPGGELKSLIESSKTIDAIMTSFAMRQRTRGFTDIRRLKNNLKQEGFTVVDKDAEKLFETLQREGLGVLVRSRRYGQPAKFLWKYDMRKVADAALKGKDAVAAELPVKMQRDKDGPRKRHTSYRVLKDSVKVTPVTQSNPPKISINNQSFLCIPEGEYQELMKLREMIRQINK